MTNKNIALKKKSIYFRGRTFHETDPTTTVFRIKFDLAYIYLGFYFNNKNFGEQLIFET